MDWKTNSKVEKKYSFSLDGLKQVKAEVKIDKICKVYSYILYIIVGYLIVKGVINSRAIVTFITGNISSAVVKTMMNSRV